MPCSPIVFQHSCHACPFLARARNHRPFHSRYDFHRPERLGRHCHPVQTLRRTTSQPRKINWQPLKGIQSYKVYRNGQLIGETQGNTYDDYDLKRTKLTLTGWMLIENIKKQPVPQHKKPAPLLIPARRLCTTTETAGTSEPHRTNRRDLKSARPTSPTVCTEPTRT